MKVVGIMLTSALLVLPAVTAFQNARGFRNAMLIAAFVSLASLVSGISFSFSLDLPAGASIVVINVAFFGLAFMVRRIAEGRAR
jgi:zinc transport system permease protein